MCVCVYVCMYGYVRVCYVIKIYEDYVKRQG